jgi:hypothetical protein
MLAAITKAVAVPLVRFESKARAQIALERTLTYFSPLEKYPSGASCRAS